MDDLTEDIVINDAEPADIPQLSELLTLLFGQEVDFTPDAQKQCAGLKMILEKRELGRIYCARDGFTIVGMVSILFTVSTALGGKVAVLEDMVVRSERRGLGVGKLLLARAISGARESGCKRITLLTDRHNTLAMAFYRKAGFGRSQMLTLRLGL